MSQEIAHINANPSFPQTGLPPKPLFCPNPYGILLWKADLAQPEAALPTLTAWLSDDERTRVAAMSTQALRQRTLASRALLRFTLGSVTHESPESFVFINGPHGRPSLATEHPIVRDFNLSHSGKDLLIGILPAAGAWAYLGVDLESLTKPRDVRRLAERVLTKNELATLDFADEIGCRKRFLQFWTLKEAFSKATGFGFSLGFERIEFELPDESAATPPRAIRLPEGFTISDWHFTALNYSETTVAALAICSETGNGR